MPELLFWRANAAVSVRLSLRGIPPRVYSDAAGKPKSSILQSNLLCSVRPVEKTADLTIAQVAIPRAQASAARRGKQQ